MIQNDALQFPLASNMAHRAHRTTRNAKEKLQRTFSSCSISVMTSNELIAARSSSHFMFFPLFLSLVSTLFSVCCWLSSHPLAGSFVRRCQMALYKHHLRSSVRFFSLHRKPTKQRQAVVQSCCRRHRRHHYQRQRTKHQKRSSWVRPDTDRSTRHNQTVSWLQFCICGHLRFCNERDETRALVTRTTTIFRMFDQLCRSPQFRTKRKSFPHLGALDENSIEFFVRSTRNSADATFVWMLTADERLIVPVSLPHRHLTYTPFGPKNHFGRHSGMGQITNEHT